MNTFSYKGHAIVSTELATLLGTIDRDPKGKNVVYTLQTESEGV